MLKNIKLLFVTMVALSSLAGCAAAPFVAGGVAAAPAVNRASSETGSDSAEPLYVSLDHKIEPDAFVAVAKSVARDLGYPNVKVQAKGRVRQVTMYKGENVTSINWVAHFKGQQWMHSVTVAIDEDGKTVGIKAETYGNDNKANPGSAQTLAEQIKTELVKRAGSA